MSNQRDRKCLKQSKQPIEIHLTAHHDNNVRVIIPSAQFATVSWWLIWLQKFVEIHKQWDWNIVKNWAISVGGFSKAVCNLLHLVSATSSLKKVWLQSSTLLNCALNALLLWKSPSRRMLQDHIPGCKTACCSTRIPFSFVLFSNQSYSSTRSSSALIPVIFANSSWALLAAMWAKLQGHLSK